VVLKAQGQLRTAGMGAVVGLDIGACVALGRAMGADEAALAVLLPCAEAGLAAAFAERARRDREEQE